jgi:predicted nucleic acid-binding protein
MIGADAPSENTVLVTNNIREFQRVEGVMLENWAT